MRGLLVLVVVALGTLHVACHSMERIPTGSEIREWPALQPFILPAIDITGVYQNIDIDSVVFYYTSSITDETQFWRQLRQEARSAGWVQTDGEGSIGRSQGYELFQRLKPKGELWFSSAEELRVAYMPARIVVGYVQSDQEGDPKPVNQASEGRFADQQIWSRFIRLVSNRPG